MSTVSTDEIIRKIDLGFPEVAKAAIEQARRTHTNLVVWRDGRVVMITPDEAESGARSCSEKLSQR